ncbi:MAG TPA: hypothetical protein VH989_08005 [Actinomycetota bacterium]|jgi:hypothetical protein
MSATGTAIQIERGRPRGAALILTAVLAAALGVGFFAGRISDSTPASTGVAVTVPAAGTATGGAAVKGDAVSVGSTGSPAIGGFAPHLPKRGEASEPQNQGGYANKHLPKQWHL